MVNEPISLQVRPGPAIEWHDFAADSPRFSIALDGYVRGGPRFEPLGPRANFNHHEDVDRLATRSTCAQVLMAIRQGLFGTFRDQDGARATVWVNDPDEDVCVAWALLHNHHLAVGAMNPMLNRLVAMEDALDCTAGAYPFPPDLPALRELAWVFEPYRQFRLSGQVPKADARAYRTVIVDVEARVMAHVTGRGDAIPLDTRYERIGGGAGWVMVREIGAQARTGMFSDGVRAFVAVSAAADGRHEYKIGRLSPFVPLDLGWLCAELNAREAVGSNLWGGSDIIIGSPRVVGSRLSPDDVARTVNEAFEVARSR